MSRKLLLAGLLTSFFTVGPDHIYYRDAVAQTLWTSLSSVPRKAETLPDFVELAAKLSPAVVNISTEQKAAVSSEGSQLEGEGDPFSQFGKPLEPYSPSHPQSLGSGFIINSNGYILTNNHVVEDGQQILVTLKGGHQFTARLAGHDSKTDVALLKIDAAGALPIAPLGDSDDVRVGEWVMAIGNPFGFDHSVTAGIVSAKGRFIPGNYDDFIQTDASINPGNSGGPLITTRGAVVGINSAIYTHTGASMGIGFAIPVNLVKQELSQLQVGRKIRRGWLGVFVERVSPEVARQQGLGEPRGAMVAEVIEAGPAAAAGLERGDIIVEFDHRPVDESQMLPLMVGTVPIGQTVRLKIIRHKAARIVPVVVEASREEQLEHPNLAEKGSADLGLSLEKLTGERAHELNLGETHGVLVSAVTPGSAAAAAGLRAQDIIIEVNQRTVDDVASCQNALAAGSGVKPWLLLVRRDRATLFIPLKRQG
jgi:serine protease Do